jgi:hypothetical protein
VKSFDEIHRRDFSLVVTFDLVQLFHLDLIVDDMFDGDSVYGNSNLWRFGHIGLHIGWNFGSGFGISVSPV